MRLIYIKFSSGLLFLLAFSGCIQSTAFLGPAVTVASTGNIYRAGLSYGSNTALQHITGKTPIENIKTILKPKENENKIISSVKKKIEKNSAVEKLLNQ
tara:strand:+ start:53 stop:349 length:297 start_codon:yes stop_codon:yes gene_type:complete